jgi:hypothetical protein
MGVRWHGETQMFVFAVCDWPSSLTVSSDGLDVVGSHHPHSQRPSPPIRALVLYSSSGVGVFGHAAFRFLVGVFGRLRPDSERLVVGCGSGAAFGKDETSGAPAGGEGALTVVFAEPVVADLVVAAAWPDPAGGGVDERFSQLVVRFAGALCSSYGSFCFLQCVGFESGDKRDMGTRWTPFCTSL